MSEEALMAIALELRRIADAQAPPNPLGFGKAPKNQQYVFCNRKNGGVWYTLNEQSQPVNIEWPALTGYIRKIEPIETVRRQEKSWKLHVYIEADRLYVLEGSLTAHFSRGLMSAIALLDSEALKEPITIVPMASTENAEVLFCNVYQGDKQVFAPYDESTDFKRVLGTAVNNTKMAIGSS